MTNLPNNVQLERHLDASPSAVWQVLADFGNIADWNSGIKASTSTSTATQGVGAQRHCDLAPAGALEETIREWDEQRRMVVSIDEASKIPMKAGLATFELTESNGGTDFSLNYDFAAKGGPFAGLMGRMMTGQLRKGFTAFIDDLEQAAMKAQA